MVVRVEMFGGEPLIMVPVQQATLQNLLTHASVYFPGTPHEELYFEAGGVVSPDEVGLRRFPKCNLPAASEAKIDIPILSRPTLGRALKIAREAGGAYPLNLARVYWSTIYSQYRLTLECTSPKEQES